MIYRYVIAIAIKVIPYSLVLGFLLPLYSGMIMTYALATAFILAVITSIVDMTLLPESIIPNADHKNGLLISAFLDVAITYPVIWAAHLLTGLGPYSIQGFLFISVLIGMAEILLHIYFNWALSPRIK